MPAGEQGAHVRLLEQVPLRASDEEILLADSRDVSRPHAQHPDIGAADSARQLDTRIDRDFLPVQQSNLPAEERVYVGAGRRNAARRLRSGAGEPEHTRALQEERPLLRKEHREAREVDLPRVDFGFAEIGVERGRQLQAGGDVVERVETGLPFRVAVAVDAKPAAREERAEIEPDPLRQAGKIRDLACLGHLVELCVQPRTRPAVLFQLPVDVTGDVEAPNGPAGGETKALERNRELRDPPPIRPPAAHVPDGVPVRVQLPARHQAVHQRPGRVRREVEGTPLIAEGVEQNLDAIVGGQATVACHLRADHLPGLGVMRDDADIEVIAVVQEGDVGGFSGPLTGRGQSLDEVADFRGGAPDRLVQNAVERDRRRRGSDRGGSLGRLDRLTLAAACCLHQQRSGQTHRGKRHETLHRVGMISGRGAPWAWRSVRKTSSRSRGASHLLRGDAPY